MTVYVCVNPSTIPDANGYYPCLQWVAQSNFIVELSQLTYYDSNILLSYTIVLFASAWAWRRVSLHASR